MYDIFINNINNTQKMNRNSHPNDAISALEKGIDSLKLFLLQCDNLDKAFDKLYPKIIRTNNIEAMRLIIDFGFDVNTNNKHSIILCSCMTNNLKMMELLVKSGASIDITDQEQKNVNKLLYNCCMINNVPTAKFLLDMNLDINMADGLLLIKACSYCGYDMVKLFLDYGADINSHNGTALIEAARFGRGDVVELLLDKGASTNVFTNVTAKNKKYDKTFILLTERGVNPLLLISLFMTR
ncbi:ankyrin repeat domain-containing protein 17-like [Tupanvirus soda lake]|uniref:Ankyrin repeat domain-containing protein 17-like n=2 Tax=Tupanvirus TaxID=2094720 RepID=A0A6N1NJW4_9VIRU|nr:ankyrin repeat domain-containing protein 17-like [Tupanvirus soda lake]QKU34670.1 ankyrin repeat domain-containing protein 17-like [Tupanvirus soda lake]